MKAYRYVCPKCKGEGLVNTTDRPPEKDSLCARCWRNLVFEKAMYHIEETFPSPARLDFICEMLVKEYGLEWEMPLRMMRLSPDYLRRLLERKLKGKIRFETMIFIDDPRTLLEPEVSHEEDQ